MSLKLLQLLTFFMLLNCKAQIAPLYVGTYTNGDSEGIYKLDFNTETGELNNKTLAVATQNPSFITFSPNKNFLYAVGEGETSAVTAFKLNEDGTLKLINSESSNGKGPCHVALNELGDKAVVSNYGGGTISIYSINENGSLEKASQIFNHNEDNEKPARAHSAKFYKDDLFVSDLGRNRFYQYKLVDNTYQLESNSIINIEGNPGPRHFSISKDGSFIYIINEYGGSITSIERTDSGFKQIDFDSVLSDPNAEKSWSADIHLSKNERFLYGSDRVENTIAVFKRDKTTGSIVKIHNISVNGEGPRNFILDPTGKFLLVANQYSENISVFIVDKTTGTLQFLHDVKVPTPVCLLF